MGSKNLLGGRAGGDWLFSMTAIATKLVDEFRQLEPSEQHWVCQEILRMAPTPGYGLLTDDELTAVADQTFVLLDKEEEAHAPAR